MPALSVCDTKGSVCSFLPLQSRRDHLAVWWYGGILKNRRPLSVPNVVVSFRKIGNDGNLGEIINIKVDLTSLGLLRIGSIWSEGVSKTEIAYQTETFDVNFSEIGWKLISPWIVFTGSNDDLISKDDYPLYYKHDKNWLISFKLQDGRNLFVPCLEFYSSCYGYSEEARRVLATYPWEEVQKHFYVPSDRPALPDQWPVKFKRRLVKEDVVLLAHILYDDYTKRVAKSVYAQIESAFLKSNKVTFVEIRPWFQGPAQMMVKGLWINENRTFLGLQVVGCSDPGGVPIYRSRDFSEKAANSMENVTCDNNDQGGPISVLNKLPDIIDLTEDNDPDRNAPTIDLDSRRFVVLGTPRAVIDDRRKGPSGSPSSQRNWIKSCDVNIFASGDRHGSGKAVGYASIRARAEMESHGMLRDMWNALLYLKKKNPDVVASVEWFTFDSGFSEKVEPQLIGLNPFAEEENDISSYICNWLYFDVLRKIPRGMLLSRIVVDHKVAYIAEIQRRTRKKKTEDDAIVESEESFKGLIFTLNDQEQFEPYLHSLLSDIRHVKGVVEKLTSNCPGYAATFKHVPTKSQKIFCETAVENALGKIGIIMKEKSTGK